MARSGFTNFASTATSPAIAIAWPATAKFVSIVFDDSHAANIELVTGSGETVGIPIRAGYGFNSGIWSKEDAPTHVYGAAPTAFRSTIYEEG